MIAVVETDLAPVDVAVSRILAAHTGEPADLSASERLVLRALGILGIGDPAEDEIAALWRLIDREIERERADRADGQVQAWRDVVARAEDRAERAEARTEATWQAAWDESQKAEHARPEDKPSMWREIFAAIKITYLQREVARLNQERAALTASRDECLAIADDAVRALVTAGAN